MSENTQHQTPSFEELMQPVAEIRDRVEQQSYPVGTRAVELARITELDEKTGLGNERKLYKVLNNLTREEDLKEDSSLGLMMFDLDKFKDINDTLGHPFGDKLLSFMGNKLQTIVRPQDVSVRFEADNSSTTDTPDLEAIRKHGDEFFIITPDLDDTRNGGSKMTRSERHQAFADRVKTELIEAVKGSELGKKLAENGLTFGLSIAGVEYTPGEGVDSLLERADQSMYVQKRNGKEKS